VSRYRFIEAEKRNHSVRTMCRVLTVSHAAYYRWGSGYESDRCWRDRVLLSSIRATHRAARSTYGYRRVHAQLRQNGVQCGRNRVARLMAAHQLSGLHKPRFRRPRPARGGLVPDLVGRCFAVPAPDLLWMTDVTQIPTREGWLYLAGVLDAYSRRLVGWSTSDHNDTALALAAVRSAVATRRPTADLIHHSDRGSPFLSTEYAAELVRSGLRQSVGRPATCYDNAVIESYWATLKKDLIHRLPRFATREQAQAAVFEYIEVFYHRRRLHSALGYLSPAEFETAYHRAHAA